MKPKSNPKKTWLEDPEALKRLYPPRAEVTANPLRLPRYEKTHIAQFKYNDVRTLIFLFPDGAIEMLTRQREPHRGYRLTSSIRQALESLNLSRAKPTVLDGGIVRDLNVRRERPIILWDILVHEGEYLLGWSYQDRYALLLKVSGNPTEMERMTGRQIGLKISETLWLAPIFHGGFSEKFRETLAADYLEGLLLKDPEGKLERGLLPKNNVSWQLKVRKPRADYVF